MFLSSNGGNKTLMFLFPFTCLISDYYLLSIIMHVASFVNFKKNLYHYCYFSALKCHQVFDLNSLSP